MDFCIRNALPSDFESIFILLSQLWPDKDLDKKLLETVYGKALAGSKDFALCH